MKGIKAENNALKREQLKQSAASRKYYFIIIAYPFFTLLFSIIINLAFSVSPLVIALPNQTLGYLLALGVTLLVINHSWLMTATELTRLKFNIQTTPEEWASSDFNKSQVSASGFDELERVHNAHRNSNENSLYFCIGAFAFLFFSPTIELAYVWLLSFTLSRLGYTYAYLKGKDNLRGLFMSLSLLATYGVASYLMIAIFQAQ